MRTPVLFQRFLVFFGQPIRLPGWVMLLVAAYSFIPDNVARLEFWANIKIPLPIASYLSSTWAGLVLVAMGVTWLWHFRGAVHVHHHSTAIQPAGLQATASLGSVSVEISDPRRDTWIQDAMMFVVNRKWPEPDAPLSDDQFSQKSAALQEMRQSAADGKILIWGKLAPQGLHVIIPRDFWIDHQVKFLRAALADREKVATEKTSHGASSDRYDALMVSKAQIESQWPAA